MYLSFLAPSSSRLLLGLLGYSLVQQSSVDRLHLDKMLHQIGNLLSKTTNMDQIHPENENYNRASLDDYELGRLLGHGCNAAVYEARLRPLSNFIIPSESDIEILSRQSSYEDVCETFNNDEEERTDELTFNEGN